MQPVSIGTCCAAYDPSTGMIFVTTSPAPQPFSSNPLSFASTPPASTLPASTPGPRGLRAYYYSGSVTNTPINATAKSAVVPVMLRAGGNVQTLTVTLP